MKHLSLCPSGVNLCEQSKDAKEMVGTSTVNESTYHHTLTASLLSHEEKNIEKVLNTMESFTNPFTRQSNKLFNLVTEVVVPEKV